MRHIYSWQGKMIFPGVTIISREQVERIQAKNKDWKDNLPRVNLETGDIYDMQDDFAIKIGNMTDLRPKLLADFEEYNIRP